jgi:hypothetical protein
LKKSQEEKEGMSLKLHNTFKELISIQQDHKEMSIHLETFQNKCKELDEENCSVKEKALQQEKHSQKLEEECKLLRQQVASLEVDMNKLLLSRTDYSPNLLDIKV